MFNEVIILQKEKVINVNGVSERQIESHKVFAKSKSVGYREFYQASAVGLKPEIVFSLADYTEYRNEPIAIYQGEKYDIIRTYITGNGIELTCSRRIANGTV